MATRWRVGIRHSVVQEAVACWRTSYDRRAREAAMSAWPHFMTTAAGEPLRLIHVRSPHVEANPRQEHIAPLPRIVTLDLHSVIDPSSQLRSGAHRGSLD